MQMFRKPIERACQVCIASVAFLRLMPAAVKSLLIFKGDRLGICVTQFDPKLLERGLVCSPGSLPTVYAGVASVNRIKYFKGSIATSAKFHISLMHETVMARLTFFGLPSSEASSNCDFDWAKQYKFQEELLDVAKRDEADSELPAAQFVLLEFERPVTCSRNCLIIGAKLDTDIHANTCRLAFHGRLIEQFTEANYREVVLPKLKVFKCKAKEGVVERKSDDYSLICRGLFKRESKIDSFLGLRVKLSTGEDGVIEGSFGQSGKFKVRVPSKLALSAVFNKYVWSPKSLKKLILLPYYTPFFNCRWFSRTHVTDFGTEKQEEQVERQRTGVRCEQS